MLDPKLAKLEATVAAGTVSERCSLFCAGGLPSKVADLCTELRNRIGSSVNGLLCAKLMVSGGGVMGGGVGGSSNAPKGSFSVINIREILKNIQINIKNIKN